VTELVSCDHEVTTMAKTKMKSVGVREFRDHATTYLSGTDPVAVSKHGQVIGFYIPLERDEDEVKRAVVKLGEAVEQVLQETGMSEEELARLFDLRQPLPE
jgi:antitoxin (DNA-binding transcriptional repressor) of toxin-antitoxin stability system